MSRLPVRILLRDEGRLTASLVDLAADEILWQVSVPAGRNLFQLDSERWLMATDVGYQVRSIATGAEISRREDFPATLTAAPGCDGSIVLSSIESLGAEPEAPSIRLRILTSDGSGGPTVTVPGYAYARLVTALPTGNYLITSNQQVIEVTTGGSVVWHAKVVGATEPHCWQALRLLDGTTLVSGGYAANLQLFDRNGVLMRTILAPPEVRPFFFAGLQQLPSGDLLVANWQGHGDDHGTLGHQILLFDRELNFALSWRQDPRRFSSIQGLGLVNC